MEKLTGSQILELIEKKEISWDDLGEENVDWDELEIGEVQTVDSYGGEGMGEKYYHVYHFVDHNVYMVEVTGRVIRVYIQTLNKSGKWSKNVVISNDIKAVIYEA